MKVTIHQPDFLPWLGFFARWHNCDLLILLDNVQFIRRGWQHRDKIQTANGVNWLTVPTLKKGRFSQRISDVEIDTRSQWPSSCLNSIYHAYSKAPNFHFHYPKLENLFKSSNTSLLDLNISLLEYCAGQLKIDTPFQLASQFPDITGKKTERLVQLTIAAQGTQYCSGLGSKAYLDEALFAQHGIRVNWYDFNTSTYQQLHGPFVKGLSILDYLFMDGRPDILK